MFLMTMMIIMMSSCLSHFKIHRNKHWFWKWKLSVLSFSQRLSSGPPVETRRSPKVCVGRPSRCPNIQLELHGTLWRTWSNEGLPLWGWFWPVVERNVRSQQSYQNCNPRLYCPSKHMSRKLQCDRQKQNKPKKKITAFVWLCTLSFGMQFILYQTSLSNLLRYVVYCHQGRFD